VRQAGKEPEVTCTFLITGEATRALPVSIPPGRMLSTPSGKPPSLQTWPNSRTERGARSDGLMTTLLPAASANASFLIEINRGWLKLVMRAQVPSGSRLSVLSCEWREGGRSAGSRGSGLARVSSRILSLKLGA